MNLTSTVLAAFVAHVLILSVCGLMLLRNIRYGFVTVFAVAALSRCVAFAPVALAAAGSSISFPVRAVSYIADLVSLVLFVAGFGMLALFFARDASRATPHDPGT